MTISMWVAGGIAVGLVAFVTWVVWPLPAVADHDAQISEALCKDRDREQEIAALAWQIAEERRARRDWITDYMADTGPAPTPEAEPEPITVIIHLDMGHLPDEAVYRQN